MNLWTSIRTWFVDHGIAMLWIIFLALVGYFLLRLLVSFVVHRITTLTDEENDFIQKRTNTITAILYNAGVVAIVVTASVMILEEAGIPITALLASVGVVGLAFGLGAQTLVKDVISGLFILIENQYTVGEVIEVSGVIGTVETMTLRVTSMRDATGTLHHVPNGEIRVVANRTRDWSRAIVDVGIAHEADIDRALAALQKAAERLSADEALAALLLEAPQVVGVESVDDWAVRLRVTVKTKPNEQWLVQRRLRQAILSQFAEERIAMPLTRQERLPG
jgi:moderate conductance mechanosensitive channel